MIILFSLGDNRHCFFCSAAVGSSPPSDAENNSLFVLKVNDFVCVCVCCCLARALSLSLFWWWDASSLSLCFVLMMEWYDHSLFVLVMDGFVSLCVSLLGGRALSFCFGGGTHSLFCFYDDGIIWSFSFLSWWWTALRVLLLGGRALSLCFSGGTRSTSL